MLSLPFGNRISPEKLAAAHRLAQKLSQDTGRPFVVVVSMGEWQAIAVLSCADEADVEPFLSAMLEKLPEPPELGREPQVLPWPDEGSLLLLPLSLTPPLIVAGLHGSRDADLLRKYSAALREQVQQQHELDQAREQLEAYASQVTSDFEELAWLRRLAEHVQVCDVEHNLAAVAKAVGPSLRELILAERVLFVLEPKGHAGSNSAAAECLDFSSQDDAEPGSLALARRVIDFLGPELKEDVLVRNARHRDAEIEGLPGVRSCILVRMVRYEHQFGWLLALNKLPADSVSPAFVNAAWVTDWEFGTFEGGLAQAAASLLASHAHNLSLLEDREALMIGVIRALINAIDAKDSYTCGHSDRVALIARRLAQEIALPAAECERVYMAGLLHDIGKIGIPDNVLCKPDELTDEEFAVIQTHPGVGYSILKHVAQLRDVLPGVLHHHETFDGRGYPLRLAGEDIPLSGRILAIADAYDAMTSSRPYRSAMSAERAEQILRQGAGRQWDARLIEAFLGIHAEIRELSAQGSDRLHSLLQKGVFAPPVARGEPDALQSAVTALQAAAAHVQASREVH